MKVAPVQGNTHCATIVRGFIGVLNRKALIHMTKLVDVSVPYSN
jgi:hypothetical protein